MLSLSLSFFHPWGILPCGVDNEPLVRPEAALQLQVTTGPSASAQGQQNSTLAGEKQTTELEIGYQCDPPTRIITGPLLASNLIAKEGGPVSELGTKGGSFSRGAGIQELAS